MIVHTTATHKMTITILILILVVLMSYHNFEIALAIS